MDHGIIARVGKTWVIPEMDSSIGCTKCIFDKHCTHLLMQRLTAPCRTIVGDNTDTSSIWIEI